MVLGTAGLTVFNMTVCTWLRGLTAAFAFVTAFCRILSLAAGRFLGAFASAASAAATLACAACCAFCAASAEVMSEMRPSSSHNVFVAPYKRR